MSAVASPVQVTVTTVQNGETLLFFGGGHLKDTPDGFLLRYELQGGDASSFSLYVSGDRVQIRCARYRLTLDPREQTAMVLSEGGIALSFQVATQQVQTERSADGGTVRLFYSLLTPSGEPAARIESTLTFTLQGETI